MFNFYDIVTLFGLENIEAIEKAKENFLEDFRTAYNNISLSEKEREKNLDFFVSANHSDMNNEPGLYANSTFLVFVKKPANVKAKSTADLTGILKRNVFDRPKMPLDNLDFDFYDCIANARALGYKQGSKDYYINANGHYYYFDLLFQIWQLIGTGKKSDHITFDIQINEKYPMLWMTTKNGVGFLLPSTMPGKYEVSNRTFLNLCKSIENRKLEKIA